MHLRRITLIVISLLVMIVMGCAGMDTAKKTEKGGAPTDAASTSASPPSPVIPPKSDREVTVGAEESISKSDSMKTADKSHIMKEFDGPVKKRAESAKGMESLSPPGPRLSRPAAPLTTSGLKAGFADDNKQFNYFVSFLQKYENQVRHYAIPIEERILLKVRDKDGKTVGNAGVAIYDGQRRLCEGKSYADGTFLFFPSEYDKSLSRYRAVITYQQGKQEILIDRQGPRELTVHLDRTRYVPENTPLDILFIMDTTGSMGEEISRLKNTIEIINLNLASLSSKPKIRFGMVLYKDRGDEYVTQVIPLTADLEKFRAVLNQVIAGGGGDNPEDLQSALQDSIEKIKWNKDGIRLCYIITDATAHLDYGQKYTYVNAVHDARQGGIKMFTIGTGGLDISGEYILRQISQYTYAKYIFLTYGERGEAEGGKEGSVSHHTGANFQTDKLESIIIRFTKEELSYLSDQPLTDGEAYFQAVPRDDELKGDTLQKLFEQAVSQLIDYSSIQIAKGTAASLIPFAPEKPASKSNAEYFTEQMGFSLTKNKIFRIVERKDMQKILDELKLQGTGIVDDRSAAAAGKLMGAAMIITGKIYLSQDNYEIFLKLLRVETGEVLAVNKLKIDRKLGL
ncbi:MAG: VWA domain-containing protein [Syntrophales bacterium]